ncbi:MAG: Asp-tRNA(Asn)/Glu-tRNA(Gln) amidotransferase subunit GatB [Deltaproteobacteria bacterium]|nr:Asp-tRNA(Asn)/Glu-tRNA(Gln) amidotransferase subunit GatB [Candidatus Anaeroferrophillacea bacterium]
MDYEVVIGLEVHAQMRTATKIFCSCSTSFGDEPNRNTCPVCTGQPGALPVLNRRVVEFAIRAGLATGCRINSGNVFARKNYFYPDLPKGYQISQYELPVCEHGHLDIDAGEGETRRVGITRIHMEEDAGKLVHPDDRSGVSYVDYNRACVPLLEIVSEPDMRSAAEAVAYLKALRDIVMYLGICDGNMEEGSFRCDANVSIRPRGQEAFGTRTELKNMNSFRNVQRAVEFEVERQIDVVESGGAVVQETRLWDVDKGITVTMRGKEEAHDYRYFPDPDLLPVVIDDAWIDAVRRSLPELPRARCGRFMATYGLAADAAGILTGSRALADYYEAAVERFSRPVPVANWMISELLRHLNDDNIGIEDCPVTPDGLGSLLKLVDDGTISGKIAKKIFAAMYRERRNDPGAMVEARGLRQLADGGELEGIVDTVLAEHPAEADSYRGGNRKVFGFLVGQVMRRTKGTANPGMANDILRARLEG